MLCPIAKLASQNKYALPYLQGDYGYILENSRQLNDAEDYFWNAYILDKQGKTLLSISVLNQGIEIFNDNELLEKLYAEFLFRSGQYTNAKPYLLKYQSDPGFMQMLVKVLEYEGDYKGAIRILQQVLEKDSVNLEFLSRLGDNYFEIDSIDHAIESFRRLVRLNPDDQLSQIKLANFYLIKKEYGKAVSIADSLLKTDSTNNKAIRIRGIANFRSSKFKDAVSDFTKLMERGDSGIIVLKHLGISESKTYAFHDSRAHLSLAYRLDSMDREICFFLARGFLNSRTPEKGLYYLERADSLLQPDPEILATIYLEKVSIYSTLKWYDEALYSYLLAYKYSPKPEYLFYIGSLYQYRFEDKMMALEYYERFLLALPEMKDTDPYRLKDQQTITLKQVAIDNIEFLKEELFFKGDLKDE